MNKRPAADTPSQFDHKPFSVVLLMFLVPLVQTEDSSLTMEADSPECPFLASPQEEQVCYGSMKHGCIDRDMLENR